MGYGPIISAGKPWQEGVLFAVALLVGFVFWDPQVTSVFVQKLPWLGVLIGWVRHLLHFLGW